MLFRKLTLKNIRSYPHLEVEFPNGSILLSGDIGSGKTSILLGLQFALFGLQPGQKGDALLRKGETHAYASVEVEVDGQIALIERTIKKSTAGSISQDSNIITLGDIREDLSTSELKERVIRLLNYPKEFIKKSNLLYKFTVYTPQEEMKSILQERPEIRLDTLRHIFGIDRYKRIKDNSGVLIQKIKESLKLKEVLVSELGLLKEKFTSEREKKISLARETNNLQISYEKLRGSQVDAQTRLDATKDRVEEASKLRSELGELRALLLGKKDLEARMKKEILLMEKQSGLEVDFSTERLTQIQELLFKHKAILEEKTSQFHEVNSKISVLESEKKRPSSLKETIMSLENCPTCFQGVGSEHKEKITKRMTFEIEDINRELEQALLEKQKLATDLDREKDLLQGYEADKALLENNKIKWEHKKTIEVKIKSDLFVLERTTNEITELNSKIGTLESTLSSFDSVQDNFDMVQKEFAAISEEVKSCEIVLATKNTELEILKSRLEELEKEIQEKEKIREDSNYLRGLQDFLSEKFISMINLTEKNVMAKLRGEFSAIFSEWFSLLTSDSLSVRLDEDFTPIITNQDYEIDYDFLSGGERTAVALAYRLSLNQVLNSMLSHIKTKDIVILDEPTDGFASEQIDRMRDIFEQLKAKQIILVSHEQKIEGFVDHVIKIKKDGDSMIVN